MYEKNIPDYLFSAQIGSSDYIQNGMMNEVFVALCVCICVSSLYMYLRSAI